MDLKIEFSTKLLIFAGFEARLCHIIAEIKVIIVVRANINGLL